MPITDTIHGRVTREHSSRNNNLMMKINKLMKLSTFAIEEWKSVGYNINKEP
jgi:hypothetical protein